MSWLKSTFENIIESVSQFARSFVKPFYYYRMEDSNWEIYKAVYTFSRALELRNKEVEYLSSANQNSSLWDKFSRTLVGDSTVSILGRKKEIDEIDRKILELEIEIEKSRIALDRLNTELRNRHSDVVHLGSEYQKKTKKGWFVRIIERIAEFLGVDDPSEVDDEFCLWLDKHDELVRLRDKLSDRKRYLLKYGLNLELSTDIRRSLRRFLKRLGRSSDDEEDTLFNRLVKEFINKVIHENDNKKENFKIYQFAISEGQPFR